MGNFHYESIENKSFFNILLWMPNWIGDVILVLPTIQSLSARFPDSRITLVVKPPSNEFLIGHPAIDTLLSRSSSEEDGFLSQIKFARTLQKYRFDLGVVFPNSFRSAFMLYLTGAKKRLGYNTDGRGIFLTHPVDGSPRSKTEYRVDYFFNIFSPLGLKGPAKSFQSFIPESLDQSLKKCFKTLRIDSCDFTITLHPGGSKFPRRWHSERFGIMCQKLIKEFNAKIFILGGPEDEGIIQQIKGICPQKTVMGLTELDLRQTASIIQNSKLFIGNDSGMMHLAAMVGTPIVGIFGPGNPMTTGPFIEKNKQTIVTKDYTCSPCRQKFFKECKPSPHNKPYCIEDISVMDVGEAVQKMVQSGVIKV